MTEKTNLIVVVPAIAALRAYIDQQYDGNVYAFARESKLDHADIGKILRGTRGTKISVAYADKIEKATEGRVNIRMWLPVVRRVL